jgi:hypothetical protein
MSMGLQREQFIQGSKARRAGLQQVTFLKDEVRPCVVGSCEVTFKVWEEINCTSDHCKNVT